MKQKIIIIVIIYIYLVIYFLYYTYYIYSSEMKNDAMVYLEGLQG